MVREIVTREQAEAILARSPARTVTCLPCGVVNATGALLQCHAGDISGFHFTDMLLDRSRELALAAHHQVITTAQMQKVEVWNCRGELLTCFTYPIVGHGQTVQGVLGATFPRPLSLTNVEWWLIRMLRQARCRMTARRMHEAIRMHDHSPAWGTIRKSLVNLKNRGVLNHSQAGNPPGYGLPEWWSP
jgi:hypothetical protein